MMQTYHNKPKNWQDFELLCYHLWSAVFKSNVISRNGRQGQNQHGVDIYGTLPDGSFFGIQCKGKDHFNNSQLTKTEIDAELAKVLSFQPSLSLFVFATTSKRDAKIQEYVRIKNQEYSKNHHMQVDVKFWDCIEEMIEFHKDVRDWYEDMHSGSYAIEIKAIVENGQLTPVFNRVKRDYKVPTGISGVDFYLLTNPPIQDIFHQQPYKNHTWCEFDIELLNVGGSVLENYSLNLQFEKSEVRAISNMNDEYTNNFCEIEINKMKSERMELFHFEKDDFSLLFEPKDTVLVQKGVRSCRIGIFPKHTTSEIHIKWKLLARNFDEEGVLTIPVVPSFIDKSDIKYVSKIEDEHTENVIEEGIEYLDDMDNEMFSPSTIEI